METTTKAENAAKEDVSALSDEMTRMRGDIASLVDNVGRIGRERAEAIANSRAVSGSIAAGEAALTSVTDELRDIEARLIASTRRNPLRALGTAAAIGFVVGFPAAPLMLTILRLLFSLGGARFGEFRAHTSRRVAYSGLLGFFGIIALVFGLSAATAAIASKLGIVYALTIMAGLAILCCLVVMILMNLAERKHRAIAREHDEMRQRLTQIATLTAIGGAKSKAGRMIGLGLLAAVAMMVIRRSGGDDDA